MEPEKPEPIERFEEILFHPFDKTLNSLRDKSLSIKKELAKQREELTRLLESKQAQESEIDSIRKQVSQKHDELMEILKVEEKINREIAEGNL